MLELKRVSIENLFGADDETVIARFTDIKIMLDGEQIGYIEMFENLDEDGDTENTLVKSININEEHRNNGYGTAALKQLASEQGDIYICPDNEDAERLYQRIGEETDAPENLEGEMDEYGAMYIIEG